MRAGRGGGDGGGGSGGTTYSAGAGLDLTGTVFSIEPIAAQSVFANPTGSSDVPVALPLGTNTFVGRSAAGNVAAKPMIEAFFAFAALTLGAANTVPQVNAGGTAIEYALIDNANIAGGAGINLSKLESITALSVVANATSGSAVPTAVAAASDNEVFRRSGSSLAFGAVNLASSNAVTGLLPFANIANGSALSAFGRSANSSGVMASIVGTTDQVMRVDGAGTTLGFGSIDLSKTATVGSSKLPFANIADLAGLSVLGRSADSSGGMAAITGADGQVLRVSGTTLGFGTIAGAGIADGAVSLAKLAAGTNTGALIWWNGSAWVETANGTMETQGSRLSFGAAPSTSGEINVSNNSVVVAGKRSNAVDASLIIWGSDDDLYLGNGSDVDNIRYDAGTGFSHIWSINSSQKMSLSAATLDGNQLTLTDWASIALGATPGTSGGVRLTNNEGITQKLSGGTTINLIGITNTDALILGANTAGLVSIIHNLPTGGESRISIANTTEYRFFETYADWTNNQLRFGTSPATSGLINSPHDSGTAFWAGRNNTDSSNVGLLFWGATNRLTIGTTGVADMRFNIVTGGTYLIDVNSSTEYSFSATTLDGNQNSLTDWSAIELGSGTVATGGLIRTPANTTVMSSRKAAGGADFTIICTNGGDDIFIGEKDDGTNQGGDIVLNAGSGLNVFMFVNNTAEYQFSATGADFQGNSLTNINIFSAEANDTVVLETAYLGSARRVTALNFGAAITTTQVPTNGGDLVTFIGNAATVPTAAPVGGATFFGSNGAIRGMNTGKALESITARNGGDTTGTLKTIERRENRVQTTNATVTTVDLVTLTNGSVTGIQATVHARKDGTDQAVYFLRAAVIQEGGTAALIGAVDQLAREDQAAWDATIDISTNTARVRVTGAAATTIEWWVYWEITSWQP